jgi:hypothetical protein
VLAFSFALDAFDGDFVNDSRPAHIDLQIMARQIMLEHGFEPDFPATVQKQLADIKSRPPLALDWILDVGWFLCILARCHGSKRITGQFAR